ncbi:acetyl-CoA carboxylase carboxyl transferase subunit alpha, partial [Pseudoalteromonas sp. S1650]
MSRNYLDFALPIAELEAKIEDLQNETSAREIDRGLEEEVSPLKAKSAERK